MSSTGTTTSLHELMVQALINQNELNKKLKDDWYAQDWPYYRAVWTEVGEAVQHVKSWFWWKDGEFGKPMSERTIENVRMELIDIFHFALSMELTKVFWVTTESTTMESSLNAYAHYISKEFLQGLHPGEEWNSEFFVRALEEVTARTMRTNNFEWRAFALACLAVGMTLEDVIALYFAKSALNRFRWLNGYQDKTYIKMWPSRDGTQKVEDNEVLMEIATALGRDGYKLTDLGIDRYTQMIMIRLEACYPGRAVIAPTEPQQA